GHAITPEDIIEAGKKAPEDVATYALYLGDDALMLAQRLGHWISRAPEMEEDVALANIAQDQLGHARFLLSYAGSAWDKTEDDLAYFRDEDEFYSTRIVEQEKWRLRPNHCTPVDLRDLPVRTIYPPDGFSG